MPAIGDQKTFPNGAVGAWDGRGYKPVQRSEPGSQNIPTQDPSLWERIKGLVKTPTTTGQLASMLAPETGGLSYAIPGAVGAITAGAQDIGSGKSGVEVAKDVGMGAIEGMVPKGLEDTLASAGPALVRRGAALAEAGSDPIRRVMNAIRHVGATTGAVGAVTTGHMVVPALIAAEEAANSPAVNTAVGKGMTALSKVPKATRNFVQSGADILPEMAPASAPDFASVKGVKSAADIKAAFGKGVVSPITHLPQVPASQTVEDLLKEGVPVPEAIKAAVKGEPHGMRQSLEGLYKAARPRSVGAMAATPAPASTAEGAMTIRSPEDVFMDSGAASNRIQDEAGRDLGPAPTTTEDTAYTAHRASSRGKFGDKPSAVYLGEQPTGEGDESIPLFNVVGGPSHGSSVSIDTLKKLGIPVPAIPGR